MDKKMKERVLLQYEISRIKYDSEDNFILIPLKDFLEDKIEIIIKEGKEEKKEKKNEQLSPILIHEGNTSEQIPAITIHKAISNLYDDKNMCYEDVRTYLNLIASVWTFHNEFRDSILKKVAASKPRLNSILFGNYNTEADAHAKQLINDNMEYIKYVWENDTRNKD